MMSASPPPPRSVSTLTLRDEYTVPFTGCAKAHPVSALLRAADTGGDYFRTKVRNNGETGHFSDLSADNRVDSRTLDSTRGVSDGGGGVATPRTFENCGSRPPRNLDISVYFFFKRIQFCIFPTFAKRSGRNPRRN